MTHSITNLLVTVGISVMLMPSAPEWPVVVMEDIGKDPPEWTIAENGAMSCNNTGQTHIVLSPSASDNSKPNGGTVQFEGDDDLFGLIAAVSLHTSDRPKSFYALLWCGMDTKDRSDDQLTLARFEIAQDAETQAIRDAMWFAKADPNSKIKIAVIWEGTGKKYTFDHDVQYEVNLTVDRQVDPTGTFTPQNTIRAVVKGGVLNIKLAYDDPDVLPGGRWGLLSRSQPVVFKPNEKAK